MDSSTKRFFLKRKQKNEKDIWSTLKNMAKLQYFFLFQCEWVCVEVSGIFQDHFTIISEMKLFFVHTNFWQSIQIMINSFTRSFFHHHPQQHEQMKFSTNFNLNSLHNLFQRDLYSGKRRRRKIFFMKRVIKFYAYLFCVLKVEHLEEVLCWAISGFFISLA